MFFASSWQCGCASDLFLHYSATLFQVCSHALDDQRKFFSRNNFNFPAVAYINVVVVCTSEVKVSLAPFSVGTDILCVYIYY